MPNVFADIIVPAVSPVKLILDAPVDPAANEPLTITDDLDEADFDTFFPVFFDLLTTFFDSDVAVLPTDTAELVKICLKNSINK